MEKAEKRLPDVPETIEAKQMYNLTRESMEQYITHLHQSWFSKIDPSISNGSFKDSNQKHEPVGLGRTLLSKDGGSKSSLLIVNFDPEILDMLQEVRFWNGLRLGGPYVAMEINAQRQKLRVLREAALNIVRDYNAVETFLSQFGRFLIDSGRIGCSRCPSLSRSLQNSRSQNPSRNDEAQMVNGSTNARFLFQRSHATMQGHAPSRRPIQSPFLNPSRSSMTK